MKIHSCKSMFYTFDQTLMKLTAIIDLHVRSNNRKRSSYVKNKTLKKFSASITFFFFYPFKVRIPCVFSLVPLEKKPHKNAQDSWATLVSGQPETQARYLLRVVWWIMQVAMYDVAIGWIPPSLEVTCTVWCKYGVLEKRMNLNITACVKLYYCAITKIYFFQCIIV